MGLKFSSVNDKFCVLLRNIVTVRSIWIFGPWTDSDCILCSAMPFMQIKIENDLKCTEIA